MNTIFARKLTEIENLMWHDGPIISHYRDGEQDYIMLWNDVNWVSTKEHESFYLVFQVTQPDLTAYMANEVSMRSLLKRSRAIFECVERATPDPTAENGSRWEQWLNDGVAKGKQIEFRHIPADNLPTEKSFLRPKP